MSIDSTSGTSERDGHPGQRTRRKWPARRWPTWILAVTMLAACLAGMVLGHLGAPPSGASASASGPSFPSSPSSTTPSTGYRTVLTTALRAVPPTTKAPVNPAEPTSLRTPKISTSSRTTRHPGTVPRTTTATSATTTTLPPMELVVLGTRQTSGPGSTPTFTISRAPYEVGYAFDCQAALKANQKFQIDIEGRASQVRLLFSSTKVDGSGTRVASSTGRQRLVIRTAPQCEWALKVVAP